MLTKRSLPVLLLATALPFAGPAAPATAADEDVTGERGRLVLVLDASGSMAEPAGDGSTKIVAARAALGDVVDALPESADVGLTVFGSKVDDRSAPAACEDTTVVVPVGRDNRDALQAGIEDYEPFGWTPIPAALETAADQLGESGERSIVLVSDGESTCGDPCPIAQEIADAGVDVHIDVVGLSVSGKARRQLECIAEKGNGTYYDADDADDITESLTEASRRATRPFTLTGTPIAGTPDLADAPDIGTGQYVDTIPTRGDRYYRLERTAPGTTVHFGLLLEGEPEDLVSALTAEVSVLDEDGELERCNYAVVARTTAVSETRLLYGVTSSAAVDPESPCNTADEVLLDISPSERGNAVAGKPVQLMVFEEPPVASEVLEALPPLPDAPAWHRLEPGSPTTGIVPGTSIESAPILEPGTYAFDINPGENQVVGVPLDWGQHLLAQFDARLTDAIRERWDADAGVEVEIIGTLGGATGVNLWGDEPADWCDGVILGCPDAWRTGAISHTISYRSRFDNSDRTAAAALPGIQYVQVRYSLDRKINVPYTLTLDVVGTAGEGAPTYDEVEGLTAPVADSRLVGDLPGEGDAADGDEATGTTDGDSGADAADPRRPSGSEDRIRLLVGGGAAGLGVIAVLAAVVLLLRRRRG